MTMTENDIVSITEANQNFSAVARKVDARGKVVVFKNNRPTYVIYSMEEQPLILTDDEKIEVAAKRVMAKCRPALMELAKEK